MSVGANYRAAYRARSRADFTAKLKLVEQECEESLQWLEVLVKMGEIPRTSAEALMTEGNETIAVAAASIKTARSRL